MDPLFKLLTTMASEHSGISEYWRNKLKDVLVQVPQEPRAMAEVVVEDEVEGVVEEPPVAETD